MTTTDLADAGVTDEKELEEVVVLACVHVEVVCEAEGAVDVGWDGEVDGGRVEEESKGEVERMGR